MKALDLADRAGITYRQLSHWTERGWLHTDGCTKTETHPRCYCADVGSGNRRDYVGDEIRVAVRMGALTRAWVAASFAASVARSMVDQQLDICHVTGRGGPEVSLGYLGGDDDEP